MPEWDLDQAEWHRWDRETAQNESLRGAIEQFEAHDSGNRPAAAAASRWLREEARDEGACVTRLLIVGDKLAAYYALSSGETVITSPKNRERMGVFGGGRVGSSHIEWIARDRRAPRGAGRLAIKHAIYVASAVAELQGNPVLTLDPYDSTTQEMWEQMGFRKSQTELDGLRRLYLPLVGPYYGNFDRDG